jgi:phosphoenolpyruvate-protein phosphotransferase (PTS system enzyme I)
MSMSESNESQMPPVSSDRGPSVVLEGIAGSPGIAIGRAVVLDTRRPGVAHRRIPKHVADEEMERFDAAVAEAARGMREVAETVRAGTARAESSILEAYIMMIDDKSLRDDVERRVRIDRQSVEWAVDSALRTMADQLRAGRDPYLSERSKDFEFVGDRILGALTGHPRRPSVQMLMQPSIIVAHDLSPAETAGLTKQRVMAIVTEVGTRTSHTAILARALEIPAVVGVRDVLARVANGDPLIVDALRGRVTIAPAEEQVQKAKARVERYHQVALKLRELRDRLAVTLCQTPIQLRANIELPSEAGLALELGAQGIGLYRTEFLYVNRAEPPSEDEQYEIYKRVLETVAPLPVTLRTFDIGGDKFVSAFRAPPEMNPALGLRAVRLGLARPEIFLAQLRAMVRASAHGPLSIMVPMISSVRELRAVRTLLTRAIEEVKAQGHAQAEHISFGVMVEVPSAAIMAEELALEAEFLSIGTNDLVQYCLAVDRTSRELAHIASPFDPSILRLVRGVIAAGQRRGRPVSVCGAMASDPLGAVLLVGMGLRELSMEASSIPELKEALSRVSVAEAEAVVTEAFRCVAAEDVERTVAEAFAPRFADLLDADGGN